MTQVIDKLKWRYATKKYDASKIVPAEKIDRILEAVRLAPPSSGLQPFELIVVANPEIREKIKAIAWNQPQVTEASHLVVFAAWDNITQERIDKMFALAVDARGPNDGWENYRKQLSGMVAANTAEQNFHNATKQAYIGLGVALVAAAFEEVDSTPMEGFDPAALDAILGLRERNLRSVVILPIGYREASGDWLVNLQKIRRASDDQFISTVA